VITLPIVDKAIEELEWCVERGARAVLIRPAPAWGLRGPRSFALPEFDPFWKRVVELDVLIGMHSSDSGYERYTNEWMGSDSEMLPFQPQAYRMLGQWRPVEDAVGSFIVHGALSRFPELKLAVIENGSSWVAPLLSNLADVYKKMPQDFEEDPVLVFKRNVHVSPFWEEDLVALADLIGVDRVLFGSDFPHPEGLADPASYVQELQGAPEETVRKIMGANLARLMGVEDKVLR
jgi:predicted TIM-barrel fold metal-dependent hydrolase